MFGLCCFYCLLLNFVTMASNKIRCVFCKKKNDKRVLFVSKTLNKCQEILKIRVKYKLKYNDTELPTQINNTDGYHRHCYNRFTALMARYRNSLSETDYASNSSSPTSSSNTPVDISQTIPRNVTLSSNSEIACEVASSSSNSQITSGDSELNLNSKLIPEDVAPSSDNQCMSGHPYQSIKSEILSEDADSTLDSQTTLGDVAFSSTCDSIDISYIKIEYIEQLENICFFCDKNRKQTKGKRQKLHSSNDAKIYENIMEWMGKLNNEELLQKIDLFKSTNRTILYHRVCELKYLNDYNRVVTKLPYKSWRECRNIHKDIFNHIVSIIEEEVLNKRKCVLVSSLFDTYNNKLKYEQKLQPQSDINLITNHYLETKIQKHFKKSIRILSRRKKKIIIHKDCSLSEDDLTKMIED